MDEAISGVLGSNLGKHVESRMIYLRIIHVVICVSLLAGCNSFQELSREPMAYIEPGFGTRFYPGDEESRRAWAHFVSGHYGLSEEYYRTVVEVTPQNGAAWIGLAASYDRIGRFDLADRAYRQAAEIDGDSYVLLNNLGYSYMLRGDWRIARRLLQRAHGLAPNVTAINNNIAVLDANQAYFKGLAP